MSDEIIISPDTERARRLPPNQVKAVKWPVLDASGPPQVDMPTWSFEVTGLVKIPLKWTWEDFQALPRVKVKSDFHCVTRWSLLDSLWEGVSAAEVLKRAGVLPQAKYVLAHAYDEGWSTNMPFSDFAAEDVLFADRHNGQPLSVEHGGPLRLVVPRLYAWKSAKWVRGVEFLEKDQAGYWEELGYHMRGDPWAEERLR
jgi:DMSO/TMAO reductase YedYZ molybdopterin-dependent catalytic subunit